MTKTKNNLLVKLLVAVAFVLSAICMTACAKANKNISKISVVSSTVPAEIVVGKFDEAGIKIKVEYEDGSSAEMAVTTSMLDDNAKQLVNTKSGSYIITIKFRGEETKITVNVIEATEVHTVKFYNAYGYMIYRDDNVRHGQASTLPSDASVECPGYTFVEWDRATDNVTGDIDVYGIYYKVDETMTSAQMESKLVSINEQLYSSSFTSNTETKCYSRNGEDITDFVLSSAYSTQFNYHYLSNNSFATQRFDESFMQSVMVENEKLYLKEYSKESGAWVGATTAVEDYNAEVGYWGSESAVIGAIANFNLNELLEHASSTDTSKYTNTQKTFTYKKFTNGKNMYNAKLEYDFNYNGGFSTPENHVIEIVYDDNKILSVKHTKLTDSNKSDETIYFDYAEKDFETVTGDLVIEEGLTNAKELISALKSADHTLSLVSQSPSETSTTFTYNSSARCYVGNDTESTILPIIANFENNIDSTVSFSYLKSSDTEYEYEIQVSLNGKLYEHGENLTIKISNNKITRFVYYTPADESVEDSHPNRYELTVVYAD